MHPRLSLHQVAFLDESTEAFLAFCRSAGFANAVLVTPKLRAEGLPAVAEGPRIASLNHVFSRDLASDDGEAARTLREVVTTAAKLGARSVYLLTGGRGALAWEEAAERFAALIAPRVEDASERGVTLLIENAPALYADIHIAHTLADTLLLAEQARVGVCVELFACWAEAGLPALLRRAVTRCGLVQVSDYVLGDRALPGRAVPGDGAIPLERLIGELLAAGYEGVFDLELVGPRIAAEGPREAARRSAERLSEILVRLGA